MMIQCEMASQQVASLTQGWARGRLEVRFRVISIRGPCQARSHYLSDLCFHLHARGRRGCRCTADRFGQPLTPVVLKPAHETVPAASTAPA